MNVSELTTFKKRNAGPEIEENISENAVKKLKSKNLNLNLSQYSPNTTFLTPTTLDDGSAGSHTIHEIPAPNDRRTGCSDVLDHSENRSDAIHHSFQQGDCNEWSGGEQFLSSEARNVNEATCPKQDCCEENSSSNLNTIKTGTIMASNVTNNTIPVLPVSRSATEFNSEPCEAANDIATAIKGVTNSSQESNKQRYGGADSDIKQAHSNTDCTEDSMEDLLNGFRRLRISESQNDYAENSQYYTVAYTSEEEIQKCIITKQWRPENRKFVGKAWDLSSGPVYLFFAIHGTSQLCAVATLCPDKVHESFIGVNFLKVIHLPKSRYDDNCYMNCNPREIRNMFPDCGKKALETLLEYEAEDDDKSVVDDINESLIVRLGQNVGLRNLGNTCYINCILQCLAKIRWKPPSENPNDELVAEFFRMISALSEPGGMGDSVSPQLLRTQIAKFSSRFASHQQQDAHELLLYLLGELNKKLKSYLSTDEWQKSCIQEQFSGKLQNSVEFECGHYINNEQPFYTVSLSIPEKCRNKGSASVSDCLEHFLAAERMCGDNKAMCLECSGELKECTLRSQFQQLPPILILHIQRTDFSQMEKLDTEISMPLTGLQLKDLSGKLYEYNMFAICNHYGSLRSGHYTADVKCSRSNTWFTCSDSSIYEMRALARRDQRDFSSKSASIVFYALK